MFISGRDWFSKFPYETPLSTSLGSPNQQKFASAILNLTGKENLGSNLDSSGLESSIIGIEVSLYFLTFLQFYTRLLIRVYFTAVEFKPSSGGYA